VLALTDICVEDIQAMAIDIGWTSRTIPAAHAEVGSSCVCVLRRTGYKPSLLKPGSLITGTMLLSETQNHNNLEIEASENLTVFYVLFLPSRLNGGLISFRSI
jgi:hypothetical protein